MGALLSFLGGSVFRMIWGEVSAWVKTRQDHEHEIERLRLDKELEDARHARDIERLRLQSDLGIKEIEIQRDADVAVAEARAFNEAIQAAARPTGIKWVDAWNGSIRPAFATVALALWCAKIVAQGFVMQDFDAELLAVVAGFYFADRSLTKRGK